MNRLLDPRRLGPLATGSALVTAALSGWSLWWSVPAVLFAFTAGRLSRRVRPTVLLLVGVLAAGLVALSLEPAWIPIGLRHLVVGVLATMPPWFAGRFWRQYRDLAEAGRESARLRERARIAADMHDLLGHELNLIALSAGALKLAPDLAGPHRAAVADIRARTETAVERLGEVVGVLRGPGAADGPARVADLVAGAREAGMAVEARIEGDAPASASAARATAHRIVREALTNAARHAPGAGVSVHLRYAREAVEVEVRSGPGASPGTPGGGTGLSGLAERVRAAAGEFEAGPDGEGGFAVRALVPYDGAAPSPEPDATPLRRTARRRIRVTLAAGVLVPLVTLALLGAGLRGWELLSVRDSVLDPAVFAGLRPGQDRAEFAHLLPEDQSPARPGATEPEGRTCEYYAITADPFDDRSGDVYRLCFDGTALVSAEVVTEEAAGD